MTPTDLIRLALKMAGVLGIGQAARQEDLDDCFSLLNMMLGQWAQKRWLVYHLQDVSFPSTGATLYSIGPGGNIDVPRPDRIEAAFARINAGPRDDGFMLDRSMLDVGVLEPSEIKQSTLLANSVDYPLQVLEAREDYNFIPFKGLSGFPATVFYDSDYPLGTLYFNPIPGAQFELHLTLKQALTGFASLTDVVDLPSQYHEALLYNLAARLAPLYQIAPNPVTIGLAKAALNAIRMSNVQVPLALMPDGMPGTGRQWWGGVVFGGFAASVSAPAAPVLTAFTLDQSILDGTDVLSDGVSPYTGAELGRLVLGQAALGTL